MSGMVKEEIITRQAELGLSIDNGSLVFDMLLLNPQELLDEPSTFRYLDTQGYQQQLDLEAGSLVYTFCQVPVILQASQKHSIEIYMADGGTELIPGQKLDKTNSQHIFARDGFIHHLCVHAVLQNIATSEEQ